MEAGVQIISGMIKKLSNAEVNVMAEVLLNTTVASEFPFTTKYQKTPGIWWAVDILHYLDDVEMNGSDWDKYSLRSALCKILMTMSLCKQYKVQ